MALFACCCTAEVAIPADPEAVVRRYQALVDANRFEEAAALCTPAEQARLQHLEKLNTAERIDTEERSLIFLNIHCQKMDSSTTSCLCQIRDQKEVYEMDYQLRRMAGHWLMDVPQPRAPEHLDSTSQLSSPN